VLRRLMAETSDHSRYLPLDPSPLLRLGGRLSPWVPTLTQALRALPPDAFDVIHTTNVTLEGPILAAAAAARRARRPLLLTPFVHLGEPGDRRILRYYTMRHQVALMNAATRVIVQTGLEGDALRRLGVRADHIVEASVGVHPERVAGGDAARFRGAHGLGPDVPLVLFVGALARDKGAYMLLAAMQRLWIAGSDARLVLIGSTALADFEAAYAALPAANRDRVLLLRFVPDQDKRDAFAACTVFAMPSRTDTFGITYLEAWLYGKPVIGARAGGVPDVITEGQDGYLVRFDDVPALADRLAALIADPALAARLGAAGHATVLARYTWDRQLPRLLALYDEVARKT
jgi:glycosyltransferase involved in cell wall biosynthesis